MAEGIVLSVKKLNEYVSGILNNDPRLRSVKVSGEISGFKRHSSGHLYFNLKDPEAVVPCVMFRSDAAKLKFEPRDGARVVVRGSVSVFVRDGKYQLYASGMQQAGEGELYLEFLRLKEKLRKEGLFENARPLPAMPRTIGVATSDTGAALRDILNIIKRRFPQMNVLFAPCKVQGADAPREIVAALKALQRFERCDVIIVGRGGGSYEDLYCFNDELVARAIAACRVPVVSAVGHETDFTIADLAADLRAPTPSAAAELCCPEYSAEARKLGDVTGLSEQILIDRLASEQKSLAALMGSAAMAGPRHVVGIMEQMLAASIQRAESAAAIALQRRRAELVAVMERAKAASPKAIMARGYAVVTDSGGKAVLSAKRLNAGESVNITFAEGGALARIEEIRRDSAAVPGDSI